MRLAISTKNAFQAAIAVLLTVAIGRIFQLDHSYWATLTAMLMVAQTFGESVKKSFERISMTIAGCIVGTLIYFALKESSISLIILMLIVTFFVNYYFTVAYLLSVFFITLLVVFIFATLGNWNMQILEARIIETVIGAVIALISTALIFPMSTRKSIVKEIPLFVEKIQSAMDSTFARLFDPTDQSKRVGLLPAFQTLQIKVVHLRYENMFHLFNKAEFDRIMFHLRVLGNHVSNAYDLAKVIQKQPALETIQEELHSMQDLLKHNFAILHQKASNQASTEKYISMNELRAKIRVKVAASLRQSISTPSEWFKFYTMLYAIRKSNDAIGEILETDDNDET